MEQPSQGVASSLAWTALCFGGAVLICGAALAIMTALGDAWPVRLWASMIAMGGAACAASIIVLTWCHRREASLSRRGGFPVLPARHAGDVDKR